MMRRFVLGMLSKQNAARCVIGFCQVLVMTLIGSAPSAIASSTLLNPALFLRVSQSSDAASGNVATRAVDGAAGTFSLTLDKPNSYWTAEWGRPYLLDHVELVNRGAPYDNEMAGLTLRLLNLDDQIVFQTGLTNPGPAGVHFVQLPESLNARSIWIGLLDNQTNGNGNQRVGLVEVRCFGENSYPFGPPPFQTPTNSNVFKAHQSSDYSDAFPPENALDGDVSSFTHTANTPNSYWMLDLSQSYAIDRVELINRNNCCPERLGGLTLLILDRASNIVDRAAITNPGMGGLWSYATMAGTQGRYIWVGLENGKKNEGENYYVTIAEARIFSGNKQIAASNAPATVIDITNNLASNKKSYMVRLSSSVPPASNANDDNYATETKTTKQSVDAYWEVDLGAAYALYGLRVIGANGIGSRMTNVIIRLFDGAHNSVHAQRLTGTPDVFDADLNGPHFARYVRIGLEEKKRTDPAGGLEWYIGMREVEVFGRPTNEVGILDFSASSQRITPGESTSLSWKVEEARRVEIFPEIGSVGAYTDRSGWGSLFVSPVQSTEYLMIASNAAGLFIRAVGVESGSNQLSLRINEVVANNRYSLRDGYGEASDWIELRNPGNSPVNLAGYGLSDNRSQLKKWVFPEFTMEPHSNLILFVSGRDIVLDSKGYLHASFRLNKNGGALILTAPDGTTVIDALDAYPELDTDLAYGRDLEGKWRYMEPTPGGINTAKTYAGWLRPLTFSQKHGFCQTPFALTISNPNPDSTVYYSLDGSVPLKPYSNNIQVSDTKAVRARVVREGYKSPLIQTKTYLFIDNVITSSVMRTTITKDSRYAPRIKPGLLSLPTVSLVVPGQPEYKEKEGSIEIFWTDGTSPAHANCGVSRFGGSWQEFAKKSFRIKCRASYGVNKLQAPLFNGFDRGVLARNSFDEIEFRSGSQDMIDRGFYMAGRFVEDSMLDMGSLNPHGRYVHLFLNGVYWGQYDARESLVDHFLADYLGGEAEQYVNVRGNDNVGDSFIVGTPEPPNVLAWERVLSLRSSYMQLRSYLDIPHLIDFMLLWLYGNCESEYRSAGPVEAGSGFKFWMADADGFLRTGALGQDRSANTGPGGIFGALVAEGHSDFKTLLADRIYLHCFNDGALTPSRNDARLAARMQEVRDSLVAECARWGYRNPSNWVAAAATIRSNLFPARTSQLVNSLRSRGLYPSVNPPVFSQYGGMVSTDYQPKLSTTNGTIYYTLDGSDPRLPGGGVSPKALDWKASSVSITQDITVNARVRNSNGQWSALAQPRFLIASRQPPASGDLKITEIHYHPPTGEDYEFVELQNCSDKLLDLTGVSLTNAIRFIFPLNFTLAPGAYTVAVKNRPAFAQYYQNETSAWYWPNINVAGEWVGSLDNQGEKIILVDSNTVELASISYQPDGDWPELAGGSGSSLELRPLPMEVNTTEALQSYISNGRNWSASSLYHGSPGRFDDHIKAVRISEILPLSSTHECWIELWNTGSQAIDLSNCIFLSHAYKTLSKGFATNIVLHPGQFLVQDTAKISLQINPLGDRISLLQMSDTNIIRFLDSVDFPAANTNQSFGLFRRVDDGFDFTDLLSITPGASNSAPRLGPVVISEIMYAPAPGYAEFIELANIGDFPVLLHDTTHPTNAWKIEGVGNFNFLDSVIMPPSSTVILCSTNPDDFRLKHGLSPLVPVLGPWPGALDNQGETIRLLRPGVPNAVGTTPFYRADRVSYLPSAPWPQVSMGVSLEKRNLNAYGNDPASWRAGQANGTPGNAPFSEKPVWTPQEDLIFPVGIYWEIPLRIIISNNSSNALSYQATGLPAGLRFDADTIRIMGFGLSSGNYPVQITATDGQSPTVVLQFTIRLTEPFVLQAQFQSGKAQLTFPTISGQTYRVEYCDRLELSEWFILEEIMGIDNDIIQFTVPDNQPADHRFYRIRWLRN